jgi:predicted RND superfamily exporter protein
VTQSLAALPASKAESSQTYWSTGSPQLVSADRHETYAVIQLTGADDTARKNSFDAIKHRLPIPGLVTTTGGMIPTQEAINKQVSADIGKAEGFSLPVLLILLTVIFGSLAARCGGCTRGMASAEPNMPASRFPSLPARSVRRRGAQGSAGRPMAVRSDRP